MKRNRKHNEHQCKQRHGNEQIMKTNEEVIKAMKSKIPINETAIPTISSNLLTVKVKEELANFFISILDESNLTLCII